MEGGKKLCLCVIFWLIRRSRVYGEKKEEEKSVLGHAIARATSYCLLPAHSDYGPPKMSLKLAM